MEINYYDLDISSLKRNIISHDLPIIYFLYLNNDIVYIGKSTNFRSRLKKHLSNKYFDSFSYFHVNHENIENVERFYINKYLPKYNKDYFTIKRKESLI
jgi:excinuclease UvrABC nuclease subunit